MSCSDKKRRRHFLNTHFSTQISVQKLNFNKSSIFGIFEIQNLLSNWLEKFKFTVILVFCKVEFFDKKCEKVPYIGM